MARLTMIALVSGMLASGCSGDPRLAVDPGAAGNGGTSGGASSGDPGSAGEGASSGAASHVTGAGAGAGTSAATGGTSSSAGAAGSASGSAGTSAGAGQGSGGGKAAGSGGAGGEAGSGAAGGAGAGGGGGNIGGGVGGGSDTGGGPNEPCLGGNGGEPTIATAYTSQTYRTTATGTMPSIPLTLRRNDAASDDAMTAALLQHLHLTADAGGDVPLSAAPVTSGDSSFDVPYVVSLGSALAADAWYALTVDPGGAVLPAFTSTRAFYEGTPCQGADLRLFTGSLPMLARLSRTSAPPKPFASMQVILSERIIAADLADGGFVLRRQGVDIPGCASWQGCVTSTSTNAIGSFDYLFDAPEDGAAGDWDVFLRGSIHGVARTVAEAAAHEGLPVDDASGAPAVHFVIHDADWFCCGHSSMGACESYCWEPPP